MADVVLDASAVLAHLRGESGGDIALEKLPGGLICTVNLTEVVQKLVDDGLADVDIRAALDDLAFAVVSFDETLALAAGLLRGSTRARGLSLGDRACLALARREGLPALTADRAWAELDLGVEVVLIR
jgi:ribonuclease VapC